jgi:xylulokinase
MRAWLGIDIGTAGVRVAAYDVEGRRLAGAAAERPPAFPVDGAMVHDPELDWWGGTREALAACTAALGEASIAGVAVAALFPAACLVDADGMPLGQGLLYGDRRASADVGPVEEALGVRLTGDEVTPRLRWLHRTGPDVWARAARVLPPAGYVTQRLSGRSTIDPTSAARWGGISSGGAWDADALARLDLSPDLFPSIAAPTAVIGHILREAAAETGLAQGTPVVAGASDSFAALLGSGVRGPGDAMIYYGSSGTLLVGTAPFADAVADPGVFAAGSPFRLAAYAPNSGGFLDRIRTEMFDGRTYLELDGEAAVIPPGANGLFVLPHVSGRMVQGVDPHPMGAIVGLRLDHGRAEIWRAMLEAFGWMLMDARSRMDRAIDWVVAGGTGARSETWRSILSDMTGLPQAMGPADATTRGAAFLAALATGGVEDVAEMRERWLADPERPPTSPDPATHERYQGLLPGWLALDAALAGGR